MKVGWTPSARDRLAEIHEYVIYDDPAAADRLVERLLEHSDHLSDHPRIGRIVPEWGRDDLRERIIDEYRLVYRILDEAHEIHVLTVFEGHRLLHDEDRGGA